MHHCLFISEVAFLVAQEAVLYKHGRHPSETRQSLADVLALGLTCRALLEPALDVVWRCQNGIGNLIKCMPNDLWHVTPFVRSPHSIETFQRLAKGNFEEFEPDTVEFIRPIISSDWDRFYYYAKRVRHLSFGTDGNGPFLPVGRPSPRLTAQTYSELERYKETILFPNLDTLTWTHEGSATRQTVQFGTLFLSPRLRSLNIWADLVDIPPLIEFLHHIPEISPHLREFTIVPPEDLRDADERGNVYDALAANIRRLPELVRYNTTNYVSFQEFLQLRALPHLGTLRADLDGRDVQAIVGRPPIEKEFPSLDDLSLDLDDARDAFALLSRFKLTHLTTLDFHLVDCSHLAPVLVAIAKQCSPDALQVLNIDWDSDRSFVEWDETPTYDTTIDIDTLSPLFTFRNLAVVCLPEEVKYKLNDDTLSTIATAWPNIWRLRLGGTRDTDEKPGVTFTELAHLVSKCHRLIDIRIDVDATIIPSKPKTPLHRLELFTTSVNSPIEDPQAVATWIEEVFPEADLAFCERPDWPEKWKTVYERVNKEIAPTALPPMTSDDEDEDDDDLVEESDDEMDEEDIDEEEMDEGEMDEEEVDEEEMDDDDLDNQ
ncbi:hypothetical protein K474DRAFT_1068317 [Panus rudis PR-1116 ss-1]|nr:hypothetical protein K474DRAFT_1068317 [Panus rudis PR-1116 ss-1]